jgi:cyclic di-GMP phosphodiesterase
MVAVADVFDALTSDRGYRAAPPVDEAVRILTEGRGTQFDAVVLDAFQRGLDDILARAARRRLDSGPWPAITGSSLRSAS